MHLARRRLGGRRREQRRRVRAEHERDAAVVGPERSGADPGHVAARDERVEVGGPVPADPGREDVGLEDRRRHGRALEPGDGVGERVDVAARAVRSLPRGEEPGERRRVDRLDLAPEQRERPPAEPAEDVGVAPLAPRATGSELAADDRVGGFERRQRFLHALDGGAEPGGDLGREERPVGPRVPADQALQRPVGLAGERAGEPDRERDAERVAEPRGVLDRGDPLLAGDRGSGSRGRRRAAAR